MKQLDYKNILIKNIRKGMGNNWGSLTRFMILSPFYFIYLLIVFLASLPFAYLENRKKKEEKRINP